MKQITTMLLVLMAFSLKTYGAYDMYVTGGINFATTEESQLTLEDSNIKFEADYKLGYSAGVLTHIPVKNKTFVRTGALLTIFKNKFSATANGDRISGHQSTSYIDIPLTLGYSLNKNFSLYGGALASYNVSSEIAITGAGVKLSSEIENLKTMIFGVQIGAQYNITKRIGMEAYATKYLTDTTNNEVEVEELISSSSEPFLDGFGFRVLYKF